MSFDVGLNSDIDVSSRKLHIQTSFVQEQQCANVTIFDGGSLVKKRSFQINESDSASHVEKEVKQYHELVKTDIELLFHMADKVRTSNHLHSIIHLGQLFLERGFYDEAVEQFEYAKTVGGSRGVWSILPPVEVDDRIDLLEIGNRRRFRPFVITVVLANESRDGLALE